MYLNTSKKLIVLLEKDFKNTLQNKKYILGRRQDTFLQEKITQEINYEFEYSNHGEETKTEYDSNVVEIFADDIRDISDIDSEISHDQWEEDGWYKFENVKQEDRIDNNIQSNCQLANNEDLKPAILNGIEKTDKICTGQNGIQLRESDDNDNDELDPFAESDDPDYKPDEEDESDVENSLPDDLSSNTTDGSVDSYRDTSFGERIKKKERKRKNHVNAENRMSKEEIEIIQKAQSFVCTVCKLQLRKASEKELHRKSHGLRYLVFKTWLICPICSYGAKAPYDFKRHYQTHVGKKIFTDVLWNCPYCPHKTAKIINYKAHQLAHKVKLKFKCTFCSYSTSSKTVLTKHLKLHNKFYSRSSSGIYSCELCAHSTKSCSSIYRHIKAMHSLNKEDWIACPQCPYRTIETTNMKSHLQCHEQSKTFKCPQCTYSSDIISRVRKHFKLHYNKKEDAPEYNPKPVFTCPECPYKTEIRINMKQHGLKHREGVKCADCPFTCRDKRDLITHVRWHRKEGPLKCRWCSFRHTAVSSMTRHERLHVDTRLAEFEKSTKKNEKPSKCPICKVIMVPSQVKVHMSKHYTLDEREDSMFCANCPFKAKAKDVHFIEHMLCHLKKDGIKCNFCTFRHNVKRVMTVHLRLHIK